MCRLLCWAVICTTLCFALVAGAAEPGARGSLLIIGGGLRPENEAVFQKLIGGARGAAAARFVLFPCASKTDRPAREFRDVLAEQGVPREHVTIVDLMPENAERQAADPQIVEQIRHATAAFFVGGDQARIIQSLRKADGTPTPALAALNQMWQAGGVIAGSSAGAAVQSIRMLRVSGLPDKSLDVGMDALDFGISSNPSRRGLLVSEGLGFFASGIVDQHFSQFRGRLGRLSRALTHERIRFGFGIDENTAMSVSPDGQIEVIGTGGVTIVDAAAAHCVDGPLGCQLSGLKLTYLQTGDRFDPATGKALVRPEKKLIEEGTQDYAGNHLIMDIDAPAALPWAICLGLAENTSHKQEGVTLRFNKTFAHGYQYTFTETPESGVFGGYADHFYSYAIVDLAFDIQPIVGNLQTPQKGLPVDLPAANADSVLAGLWFRGILLADEQHRLRPADAITRGELAGAIAQSIHLPLPREASIKLPADDVSASDSDDVVLVVSAGLMTLDKAGRFRPQDAVTREEAAVSLVGLARLFGMDLPKAQPVALKDEAEITAASRESVQAATGAGLLLPDDGHFRPAKAFTRQEAAAAICRVIGFDWDNGSQAGAKRPD
jgi:cyanophycinase